MAGAGPGRVGPGVPVAGRPEARVTMAASRAIACLALAVACTGCRAEQPGDTSVLLHLRVEAELFRPEHVFLTWRSSGGPFRADRRVPEMGTLPSVGPTLGSVLLELDREQTGERQIVAQGMRGLARVSGATARIPWRPGQRQELELTFIEWRDSDGDGVPETIAPPDGGLISL